MSKIGIRCEKCGTLVEKEIPWPSEKVVERLVKEPCRCGMTPESRMSRHWATVVSIVIVVGLIAAAASCHSTNVSDTRKVELFKGNYKIKEQTTDFNGRERNVPAVVEKTADDKLRDRIEENARYRDDAAFWRAANENLREMISNLRAEIDRLKTESQKKE